MANGTASKALTMRKDMWWVEPLVTGVVLGAFGIYSTWRALSNQFFYLSLIHISEPTRPY